MNLASILTSCGINTAVSVAAFSLYSILRKQPSLVDVYFGQRIAQARAKRRDYMCFDRLFPSASWILKAWEASEDDLYASGGLDAVVFIRIVVFSIRIFTVSAIICMFLVLPLNYYGHEMDHKDLPDESTMVFTTANVEEGSKWFWGHCLALYVITCCSLLFLYWEYKTITKLRLAHITASLSNSSNFTVLVRGIPDSRDETYSDTVAKFFNTYYASSYLSHQMVYQSGTVLKIMNSAEKMYKRLSSPHTHIKRSFVTCGLCGGTARTFRILANDSETEKGNGRSFGRSSLRRKECPAALVFFRTRYSALVASSALQSSNPMLWVTNPAPEPRDVYWSNLCVPYRFLWMRRIVVLVGSMVFVAFFMVPVTLTQGLVHLEKLQKMFPFMKTLLKHDFLAGLARGYLPSVVLMIFLYMVPPMMFIFSKLQGSISRSGRKKSTCVKVLIFMIWNVFFGSIFAGAVYEHFNNTKDIPYQLGIELPKQAGFFITYVMTSGWASLSCELLQPFSLLRNFFYRFVLWKNPDEISAYSLTFAYHTEVPRVLLIGLLGFTNSVTAPLILPFVIVYFLFSYLVYCNQLLNVYETKYQSGGLYWPVAHNTTIFSLVLMQLIVLGILGFKKAPIASGFILPLIITTLLFNEYCRQRFLPAFEYKAAEVLIKMDQDDIHNCRLEEIHEKLLSAYNQFPSTSLTLGNQVPIEDSVNQSIVNLDDLTGRHLPVLPPLDFEELQRGRRSPIASSLDIEELYQK